MIQIKGFYRPYYYDHNLRQEYFWNGLKLSMERSGGTFEKVSVSGAPVFLSMMGNIKQSYKFRKIIDNNQSVLSRMDKLAVLLEGKVTTPSGSFHPAVGQYIIRSTDGQSSNVCIDMSDSEPITSSELCRWSDIYFKANYWGEKEYPATVRPMYYINPILIDKIDHLRSLRSCRKEYDLCFIVRVWGGRNETEGIEHNLRLLEEVSKINCRKYLYAYLVSGNVREYAKRLEREGIPFGLKPLPIDELWRVSARSEASVMRLGMHYCIPWRMNDLMAMGACPIFDSRPYSVWPRALQENENFLSLNLQWGYQKTSASEDEYKAIPLKIENWLAQKSLLNQVRENNARYFDDLLTPCSIGNHIVETVVNRSR